MLQSTRPIRKEMLWKESSNCFVYRIASTAVLALDWTTKAFNYNYVFTLCSVYHDVDWTG